MVIVNYETAGMTDQLLQSVRDCVDEVVVVDNASPSGGVAWLREAHPSVRFVEMERNLGYGAGANRGAALCRADVLVISNPDVTISHEDLGRLASAVVHDRTALAAPRFVDPAGDLIRSSHRRDPLLLTTMFEYCGPFAALCARLDPEWHPTLRRAEAHAKDHEAVHVLGALMAVNRTVFEAVSGFDEGFFLYREETDLCRRVREAGYAVSHVAGATAIHVGDASSPGERVAVSVRRTAVTSHYRYIGKHYGGLRCFVSWVVGLAGSLVWAAVGRRRDWARASIAGHVSVALDAVHAKRRS